MTEKKGLSSKKERQNMNKHESGQQQECSDVSTVK